MHTAAEIADYFLARVDGEAGDSLSNLKLQKLLYYAQGLHLALTGKPLFEEPIEAWEQGPVVPSLYHGFNRRGGEPVPPPEDGIELDRYSPEVREILNEVFDAYGQFSAAKLRNLILEDPAWREAYPGHREISRQSMQRYFSTLLLHEEPA